MDTIQDGWTYLLKSGFIGAPQKTVAVKQGP